jgi:hypothetical protein
MELDEGGQWFWKVTFPLLSLLSLAASFAASSDWVGLQTDEREMVLRVFILVLGCFAAAYVGGTDDFRPRLLVLAVVMAGVAALFVAPHRWQGFASTLFYGGVVGASMMAAWGPTPAAVPGVPPQPWFRQGVVYAWAVSGALLSAAALEPVAHPRPRLPEWMIGGAVQDFVLAHLVDLRVILSVVAGTFLVGTAISRTLQMGAVTVPDIPQVRLSGLVFPAKLAPLVRPFVRAAVTVWTILRAPANVAWKFCAHSAAFLARIALQLVRLLVEEVFNPDRLHRMAAQVIFWLTMLFLVRGSGGAAAILLDYLRDVPDGRSAAIVVLCVSFVLGLMGALLFVRLVNFAWAPGFEEEGTTGRAADCGWILLLVFAVCSLVMHLVIRRIAELRISGFARLGPVTASLLVMFALAIVALFARDLWQRRVAQQG